MGVAGLADFSWQPILSIFLLVIFFAILHWGVTSALNESALARDVSGIKELLKKREAAASADGGEKAGGKRCPGCGEPVKPEDDVCPSCGLTLVLREDGEGAGKENA